MATAPALTTVQKLYIAYYGRAADVFGQFFWADEIDAAGGSLVNVIDAFANAPEAQALYGTGTTTAQRITTLYQNILGRNPDTPGLNYYVDQVNSGKLSLGNAALAILDGVQPGTSDAPLANNRMDMANAFTAQVGSALRSYDGDAAAAIARTFLKQVTGDAATVTQANNQLPAWLNTVAVASKQGTKFAPLISNGLLAYPAIVSPTLSEANLDVAIQDLFKVQLEAINKTNGFDNRPQITALGSSGEFAVAFEGVDSVGDSSIFVQKFAANGTPTGNMVQLEAIGNTTGNDFLPQITAVGSSGEFVVTWEGEDSAGDRSIFVQKFAANGTPTGNTVQLEAINKTNGNDNRPQITALGSGGEFAVAFEGVDSVGDSSIFVQKFAANGTPTGNMVQLEALNKTDGNDIAPQITAVGSSGEFAVTWQGQDSAGDRSIFVRKFAANGTPTGNTVQLEALNKTDGFDNRTQITALGSGGEFAVAFEGVDSVGDSSIFVQKFAANGTPTGNMVQLEALNKTDGNDIAPQITAVGSGGEFVVTWEGDDSGGDPSIFVQKFAANGTATGSRVQLEGLGNTTGFDFDPQITALGSGGAFAVTWYGEDSAGDYSIFVQKFAANGTPTGSRVQLEALGNSTGGDFAPQITAVGSGEAFAVTWEGIDSAGDYSIFVQPFNAAGQALPGTLRTNTSTPVTVQSREASTADLASTMADTDTALATTGLDHGGYRLYTADAAGNLSAPVTDLEVVGVWA